MRVLPPGQFVMGAAPGEEARENLADEFRGRSEPQRSISVGAFAVGQFEITRGQFGAFVRATGWRSAGCFVWARDDFELDATKSWQDPAFPQHDDHPVTCVSWEDATAYVRWLSERTGKRYRLPSEAEWEYAARAGTNTPRFWGADPAVSCDYANTADLSTQARVPGARDWAIARCDDAHAFTAPIGSYRSNAFGLHDMLGNVEEWTQDCWNGNYRGASADARAATSGDCQQRAVRGGSWLDAPAGVRAAYRVGSPTSVRVYRRGFRVARDV
jgi:formylglycine-generating enzyme required for sulfatase activity